MPRPLKLLSILLALLVNVAFATVASAHTAVAKFYDPWKYEASGTDLGTAWTALAYDDGAWPSGVGPFGAGAGANWNTVIPLTNQTTYFRHAFTVDVDPASVTSITFSVAYVHGFVAYINGQEITRQAMPAGPVDYSTASTGHSLDPNAPFETIVVPVSPGIVAANNVLAIELHQTIPLDSFIAWAPLVTFQTSEEHVTRAPYLQMATNDAVTLRWRTSVATDSVVSYGPAADSLDDVAQDDTPTTEHEVRLEGLAADTEYFYSIGSSNGPLEGGDDAHAFFSSPPIGAQTNARFWVIGDAGTQDARQREIRDGFYAFNAGHRVDRFLMLGDNAYEAGSDQDYQFAVFEEMYEPTLAGSPLWPALGNHDWQDGSNVAYLDIFSLPSNAEAGGVPSGTERYFAFDYANVHFVCLDTNLIDQAISTEAERDQMIDWLGEDLAANDQAWTIAFFHHPPYSKGSHDSDTDGVLDETRGRIGPVLEGGGVDLVLAGHSHDYERSFLIDGQYGPSPEFLDDPAMFTIDGGDGRESGDGAYRKSGGPHQGTVYVVSGNSGGRGDGSEFPLDHPVMVELHDPHNDRTANGVMAPGSLVLDLDGQRLDVSYVDFDGEVLDSFAIIKDGSTGGGGEGAGGGGPSAGGASETGGASHAGGGGGGAGAEADADDGCGCYSRTPSPREPASLVLFAVAVAILVGRARRR